MVLLQITWEYFLFYKTVNNYSTRLSHKGAFADPKVKGFRSRSFSYIGCTLWNKLPFNITKIYKLSAFKCAIKKHFIDNLI